MTLKTDRGRAWPSLALLLATVAVAAFNGLPSSPLFDAATFYLGAMLPSAVRRSAAMPWLTIGFLGLMTVLLAGVPAAIVERTQSSPAKPWMSGIVWFAMAALLATPGLLGAVGYFDID